MSKIAKFLPLFLLFVSALFGKEKPIIMIDPGHGGRDEGAKVRTLVEKKLTLRTAYLTKKHLEDLGYRVILTRARDHYLSLQTRVDRANKRPNSLFVSIHYNSAKSPAAKGMEVYYYGKRDVKRQANSKAFAETVLSHILTETKAHSRGVKKGNFQVIRETTMPAILVEAGFITNSDERKSLNNQTYLDKIALGIAQGVNAYNR